MYVKNDGENHTFKLPVENAVTDFWQITHYKIDDIRGVPPNEQ